MEYNFRDIEQKWQQKWVDLKTYKVVEDKNKQKFYVLNMFPYPSGAGLHVGHPLGYIASEAGWIVAELGRQPWTIQDMLPTWAAVSDLHSGSIAITFFIFLALFTAMLITEISILCKEIKKGPELSSIE